MNKIKNKKKNKNKKNKKKKKKINNKNKNKKNKAIFYDQVCTVVCMPHAYCIPSTESTQFRSKFTESKKLPKVTLTNKIHIYEKIKHSAYGICFSSSCYGVPLILNLKIMANTPI
jgi:hypothetical protein